MSKVRKSGKVRSRLSAGNLLSDMVQVPPNPHGADAHNQDQRPQDKRNPEQNTLEPIHLPSSNGHENRLRTQV